MKKNLRIGNFLISSNNPLANDNVSGYTISQFQMAVFNSFSWVGIRDHLIYNNDNPTENNLIQLFNEW